MSEAEEHTNEVLGLESGNVPTRTLPLMSGTQGDRAPHGLSFVESFVKCSARR